MNWYIAGEGELKERIHGKVRKMENLNERVKKDKDRKGREVRREPGQC